MTCLALPQKMPVYSGGSHSVLRALDESWYSYPEEELCQRTVAQEASRIRAWKLLFFRSRMRYKDGATLSQKQRVVR